MLYHFSRAPRFKVIAVLFTGGSSFRVASLDGKCRQDQAGTKQPVRRCRLTPTVGCQLDAFMEYCFVRSMMIYQDISCYCNGVKQKQ